jgi:hypothetical protein
MYIVLTRFFIIKQNYMFQKLTFFLLLISAFSTHITAQTISSNEIVIAPMLSVAVAQGKTAVKTGESVTLKAQGNDQMSSLQWQVSVDGKNWQDVPKANGANFETASLTQTQFFRVLSRPLDVDPQNMVETISSVQMIALEENVASTKKQR